MAHSKDSRVFTLTDFDRLVALKKACQENFNREINKNPENYTKFINQINSLTTPKKTSFTNSIEAPFSQIFFGHKVSPLTQVIRLYQLKPYQQANDLNIISENDLKELISLHICAKLIYNDTLCKDTIYKGTKRAYYNYGKYLELNGDLQPLPISKDTRRENPNRFPEPPESEAMNPILLIKQYFSTADLDRISHEFIPLLANLALNAGINELHKFCCGIVELIESQRRKSPDIVGEYFSSLKSDDLSPPASNLSAEKAFAIFVEKISRTP